MHDHIFTFKREPARFIESIRDGLNKVAPTEYYPYRNSSFDVVKTLLHESDTTIVIESIGEGWGDTPPTYHVAFYQPFDTCFLSLSNTGFHVERNAISTVERAILKDIKDKTIDTLKRSQGTGKLHRISVVSRAGNNYTVKYMERQINGNEGEAPRQASSVGLPSRTLKSVRPEKDSILAVSITEEEREAYTARQHAYQDSLKRRGNVLDFDGKSRDFATNVAYAMQLMPYIVLDFHVLDEKRRSLFAFLKEEHALFSCDTTIVIEVLQPREAGFVYSAAIYQAYNPTFLSVEASFVSYHTLPGDNAVHTMYPFQIDEDIIRSIQRNKINALASFFEGIEKSEAMSCNICMILKNKKKYTVKYYKVPHVHWRARVEIPIRELPIWLR
jgi:hypothetical protein